MTDKKQTPVAKSLHTVTVLIQVAREYQNRPGIVASDDFAMRRAMELLELADRPDPYALEAKALRLMKAARA
jgi:hypothetical protein